MSERQAKLKRKNQEENTTNVKKTQKSDTITNLIIVIVIVAMVVLGAWAIYSKYNRTTTDTDATNTADTSDVQPQTVANVAEEKGLSAEDFISEYGLGDVEGINGDTDFQTAMQSMTLENYAKYLDEDVDELISGINVDAKITADMTVGEVTDIVSQAQSETSADDSQQENQTTETE